MGHVRFLREAIKLLAFKRDPQRAAARFGPFQGTICVTDRCNARCRFCDVNQYAANESIGKPSLSTERMKEVIKGFHRVSASGVAFSGGEALLRPDILDLIQTVTDLKMISHVATNGLAVTDEMAKNLLICGMDSISISIDHHDPAVHDELRGVPGLHRKAVEAVNRLAELKKSLRPDLTIIAVCVLSDRNVDVIESYLDFIAQTKTDLISFIPMHSLGDNPCPIPDPKRAKRAIDRLLDAKRRAPKRFENSVPYLESIADFWAGRGWRQNCLSGSVMLLLDDRGNYYPCYYKCLTHRPLSRLDEHDLESFWANRTLREQGAPTQCRECLWNAPWELNFALQ